MQEFVTTNHLANPIPCSSRTSNLPWTTIVREDSPIDRANIQNRNQKVREIRKPGANGFHEPAEGFVTLPPWGRMMQSVRNIAAQYARCMQKRLCMQDERHSLELSSDQKKSPSGPKGVSLVERRDSRRWTHNTTTEMEKVSGDGIKMFYVGGVLRTLIVALLIGPYGVHAALMPSIDGCARVSNVESWFGRRRDRDQLPPHMETHVHDVSQLGQGLSRLLVVNIGRNATQPAPRVGHTGRDRVVFREPDPKFISTWLRRGQAKPRSVRWDVGNGKSSRPTHGAPASKQDITLHKSNFIPNRWEAFWKTTREQLYRNLMSSLLSKSGV
ncbi:predicted protein [Uncinocarpus reesii 1704]|uniref:Uncharacterized protein n=1 Tax=Uncinocarpus reesii (strain UAMH 1704) TaxID=336963 RepID=C4JYB0_UNCRE|nr:uncharacterized protein UREG_07161 [Uncinocarpus reesii 1704]EEP82296.1 predicted protein [Uncinocarpus reesii 1704]